MALSPFIEPGKSVMPRPLNTTETALNATHLLPLAEKFGCPVWAYDADVITRQIAQLAQFDVIRFAQKACSNTHILRLMREQGGSRGCRISGGN